MIDIIQKIKDILICASEKIAVQENHIAKEKIDKSLKRNDEKWPRMVGIDHQRHST